MILRATLPPNRRPISYLPIVLFAALATAATVAYTLMDLRDTKPVYGGLISQMETDRHQILPWDEIDNSPEAIYGPHDGRFFYAIARSFPDLDAAAPYLDTPGYRSQRILFPALSRLLHPVGNGPGLIWTMFAIGVFGVFLSGFGTGALAAAFGGRAWVAALPPLFYGSWVSLRITVPDPLGLGLALTALFLAVRGRYRWAIAVGIAAVLTRETSLLFFLGYLVWRRDRPSLLLAAIPAAAGAFWGAYVRLSSQASAGAVQVAGFGPPFGGLIAAIGYWGEGYEPLSPVILLLAVLLGAYALTKRGLQHPLAWCLAIHLALLVIMVGDVLGPVRNSSRVALPIVALAVILLATPTPRTSPRVEVGGLVEAGQDGATG